MEFNEKLQKLRKDRGLTQEALAEALYVSRTAISKWESGRGYPSIDSLREIARFFSVTIDELIRPEEILSAAKDEHRAAAGRFLSLICGLLDLFPAMLLFMPVFGNGPESPAVSLPGLTGANPWVRIVFAILIGATILEGICGAILSHFDQPVRSRRLRGAGVGLSIAGSAAFVLARQPYAGFLYLALLVIKGFLIFRAK